MGRKKKREKMKPREERGPNLSALPSPSLLSLAFFTLRCSQLSERPLYQANIDMTDDEKARCINWILENWINWIIQILLKFSKKKRECTMKGEKNSSLLPSFLPRLPLTSPLPFSLRNALYSGWRKLGYRHEHIMNLLIHFFFYR